VQAFSSRHSRVKNVTGLRHWMLQVIEECDNVAADFSADSVHDLRVSLRRCRSLADGLMALDPDPNWKAMKRAGRRLFQRLGALRDIQVMMEWVERLRSRFEPPAHLPALLPAAEGIEPAASAAAQDFATDPVAVDPIAQKLLGLLRGREKEQQREAQAALEEFDRKRWKQWAKSLPVGAARLRPGSPVFKHLALERWTAARELHNRALRNRSQVAFHSLRIGIKRFRYTVENFLPKEHVAWKDGLKQIQDLLGEVHDLDVLWSTAASCQLFPDEASRKIWRQVILAERSSRIASYRAKMIGANSLWQLWRDALPRGNEVTALATRRMKLWASRLDPDFPHSERVAGLALQLYDGLLAWGWKPGIDAVSARSSLQAGALLHDVGRTAGAKGHHKVSFRLIRDQGAPLGWGVANLQRAAIVARFHRGALPTRRHKLLRDLLPNEQKGTIQLAAILRLANALDAAHDGHISRVRVDNNHLGKAAQALVILAEGYSPTGRSAPAIAAERHLLETVLHRPVVIVPFHSSKGAAIIQRLARRPRN
jgi:CHAD domain-containing protein/HD superfamily phosphodiesterase